jgi:hypothetical protein
MSLSSSRTDVIVRRDVRYPHLCELSMTYEGYAEDIPVRPPDISRHGMFVNTSKFFPEGAVVKLRFRLSHTQVLVQTRAEVRYCMENVGVGVEFVDLPAEALQAIESEIDAHAAPPEATQL